MLRDSWPLFRLPSIPKSNGGRENALPDTLLLFEPEVVPYHDVWPEGLRSCLGALDPLPDDSLCHGQAAKRLLILDFSYPARLWIR